MYNLSAPTACLKRQPHFHCHTSALHSADVTTTLFYHTGQVPHAGSVLRLTLHIFNCQVRVSVSFLCSAPPLDGGTVDSPLHLGGCSV